MSIDRLSVNPVRYSLFIGIILTTCLFYAEHFPVADMHSTMDLDFTLSKHVSQLPREIAYITIGAIGGIGIFQSAWIRGERQHWNRRVATPLVLLLAWSVLSLLWSDTPAITGKRLLVLGLTFIGALGVALSWTTKEVLNFMSLSSAVQVAIGLVLEVSHGYFTPWRLDYRFAGTLPWNSQGYVCLICSLSSLCLAKVDHVNRWRYTLLAACAFLFLLLTRSRGGLLAFSVAALLFLMLTLNQKTKIAVGLGLCITLLVIYVSGIAPTVLSLLNRSGEGASNFTGRGPLWEQLAVYAEHRPLIGYGYEGFFTNERIEDVSSEQHWAPDTAHSGYLESVLVLGIIGAFLHTLTLGMGMLEGIRVFRLRGDTIFILGASFCCVYLVGGLLESLLIIKLSPTSFYFAILLCQLSIADREMRQRNAYSSRI